MTDSDVLAETWKPIPGAAHYEASDQGHIRSLPRKKNGRTHKGTYPAPMKLREDGDGYLIVNYTDDNEVRHCGASVARLVLLAHDPDGYRPGLQACHGEGGQKDNRVTNLYWDTEHVNREEALAARAANRPVRTCPRCGRKHRDPGQRCHRCVVEIGQQAAGYLADGTDLERAAEALEYPSPIGLLRLARKHGGLRMRVDPAAVTVSDKPARQPWLRRVINRAGASRRNSDGR